MPVPPLVAIALVGIVALLWWTERHGQRFLFALAAFAVLVALVLLVTGDVERATVLTGLLSIGIIALSKVKFHLSARALIVADAPLLFAGTVPFFFTQYRRTMTAVVCGAALLCLGAVAATTQIDASHWPFSARVLAVLAAGAICAITYRMSGGLQSFRRSVTEPTGYFSTFAGSIFDVRSWWRTEALNPPGMAERGLSLAQPVGARDEVRPHIILIQHESIFDPEVFGLPVSPDVAALLSPTGGVSGGLDVEIFGGGSWQSEFSVLTGIPSGLFGTDAYFLFQRGAGRFRHSLPGELGRLGYKTALISSCRRGFLNYDAFYGSIGMGRLVFSDDLPPPFRIDAFERTFSDTPFLAAAMAEMAGAIGAAGDPQFFYVLTNFNHGPHDRRLASTASEPQRTFAMDTLGDAEYAEYFARLADTARTWNAQREALHRLAAQRPILVVHYGDHQPVMTRRIEARRRLAAQSERAFRTFYALESYGMPVPGEVPERLPIAYLAPLLLQAAGLPLDAVNATRAAMLQRGAAGCPQAEARLLRTLVDMRLVDLG